ncbi:GNAT family N-acetyltransferase [Saccharomonospora iraqiensis]|uniref:GNAT family N-acetyltransferase n=1 Tax=Saccharomonospora iraqiensis TaxID=52698 RepID=UPI00022E03C4|nr:GNAT family N-acetyltransferase [Saccharomonospora iraqiensis]
MSDLVVRRARPAEFGAVGELTVAAYAADGFLDHASGPSYAGQLRDAARRAGHADLFVAVDEADVPVGTVTLVGPGSVMAELCGPGEVEIRMLAVAPGGRGRGVGEMLTRAALDRGRELGAGRVVLTSMTSMTTAHRLYGRLGFRRVPELDRTVAEEVLLLAFTLDL